MPSLLYIAYGGVTAGAEERPDLAIGMIMVDD
jgi:hypothetical protein